MKRLLLILAGVVAAGGIAATPAVAGLAGNPSFSHEIPVPLPSAARALGFAGDHGHHASPASPTTARTAATPDDRGGQRPHAEPGDDRGGASPHIEPGDDRGGHGGGHGRGRG
jgi:hypothetical protein